MFKLCQQLNGKKCHTKINDSLALYRQFSNLRKALYSYITYSILLDAKSDKNKINK